MSKSETKQQALTLKQYFYPNLYYLIGIYALIMFIGVLLWPTTASRDEVSGVAIVSLSALLVSLVAGPIKNTKTIEHTWLKDAAASSFVTAFALLIVGASLASLNLINWQVANFATIAVVTVDFIGKLIIAKRRDS